MSNLPIKKVQPIEPSLGNRPKTSWTFPLDFQALCIYEFIIKSVSSQNKGRTNKAQDWLVVDDLSMVYAPELHSRQSWLQSGSIGKPRLTNRVLPFT